MPRKYQKKCRWCGKEDASPRKYFCSQECYWRWRKGKNIGGFPKGIIPWNKGTKGVMKENSGSFKKELIPWNKGKSYPQLKGNQNWKLRKKTVKGKEHWNWKGGVTPIRKQFWDSAKYKNWRKEIFERDHYICQNCGAKNVFLEVHHKKERYKIWEENKIKTLEDAFNCEELWNKSNAMTLCRKCHNLTKKYVKISN